MHKLKFLNNTNCISPCTRCTLFLKLKEKKTDAFKRVHMLCMIPVKEHSLPLTITIITRKYTNIQDKIRNETVQRMAVDSYGK